MDKTLMIISAFLGLFLILFFIIMRFSKSKCSKKTLMIISAFLGLFLILFFIIMRFSKSKCSKKIEATYLKYNSYTSNGGRGWVTNYAPVFRYNYNGEEYTNQSTPIII